MIYLLEEYRNGEISWIYEKGPTGWVLAWSNQNGWRRLMEMRTKKTDPRERYPAGPYVTWTELTREELFALVL